MTDNFIRIGRGINNHFWREKDVPNSAEMKEALT